MELVEIHKKNMKNVERRDVAIYSIAESILYEYLRKSSDHYLPYNISIRPLDDVIKNYSAIKNSENKKLYEDILDRYGFNYKASIQNALYKLYNRNFVEMWPGIKECRNENNLYKIRTSVGDIVVNRASDMFKNTKLSHIFDKQLAGECFARSYDFIKEYNDCNVILVELPYILNGTYYHALIECEDYFLDIAANYCYDKQYSNILNNGRIIKKLNYHELKCELQKIQDEYGSIGSLHELYSIILHHDKEIILQK